MDLIHKIILKKGFVNISDFQMVLFELEMKNKEIDYYNKRLTLTPVTGNSRYKARERYSFGVSDPLGIFGSPGA